MTSEDTVPAANGPTEDPTIRDMVLESLGGWRGFVDAALPSLAFIVANAIGGLNPAIWAGVAAGVLVFGIRLVTRKGLQQAFSGLIGLAICIFIAKQTGEAKDFFLFGIIRSAVVALALLVTIALRRPLAGYVWNFFSPIEGSWRENSYLVRIFGWLTAAWAGAFVLRFIIEGWLYLSDSTSGLGAVRIAMGYPLTAVLVVMTYLIASKATGQKGLPRLGALANRSAADRNER
ncbi:MAG: DUF3159 domain-containing protein [Cumulibacter sp.]